MASITVPRVKLGSQGLEVSQQGLGCMSMSMAYGPAKPEQDMIELIHKAVESGVTFIDTADMYGPHINEVLIGKIQDAVPHNEVVGDRYPEKHMANTWRYTTSPPLSTWTEAH